jgi:hypothetical protein
VRELLRDRAALALLLVALLLRLGIAIEFQAHELDQTNLPWIDMRTIHENAVRVADGDVLLMDQFFGMHSYFRDFFFGPERYDAWFGPFQFYDAPLYVYSLGGAYKLLGTRSPVVVPFLHALLGTATCALVYLIGRRASGHATALVALALAAFMGELVFYGAFLLRETLLALLFTWAAYEVLRAQQEGGEGSWMRAGLAFGVSWLAKTSIVLVAPFVAAALAVHGARQGRRAGLRATAAFALAALAPVVPFAERNVALGVRPLEFASGEITMIVKQNLPGLPGCGSIILDKRSPPIIARLSSPSSLAALVETLKEHPGASSWLGLEARKAAFFWAPFDIFDDVRFGHMRLLLRSLAPCVVTWALLGPLALVGAVLALRSRASAIAHGPVLGILWMGIGTALVVGAFTRYSVPCYPALAVLAAAPIVEVARRARAKQWLPAAAIALGVVACALALQRTRTLLGPGIDLGRAPTPSELRDYVNACYPDGFAPPEARYYLATRLIAAAR